MNTIKKDEEEEHKKEMEPQVMTTIYDRCIRGAHQATVFIPMLRFVASRHFRSAFPITITTARINTMPDILR
jgi:hypothetical protein